MIVIVIYYFKTTLLHILKVTYNYGAKKTFVQTNKSFLQTLRVQQQSKLNKKRDISNKISLSNKKNRKFHNGNLSPTLTKIQIQIHVAL